MQKFAAGRKEWINQKSLPPMAFRHFLLMALVIATSGDLFYEILYQNRLSSKPSESTKNFTLLNKWIETNIGHEFYHHVQHAAQHASEHIATHLCLIFVACLLAAIGYNSRIYDFFSEKTKNTRIFYTRFFMNLGAYELLLLYTESFIIAFYEMHDFWKLFSPHKSAWNGFSWFLVVLLIVAPFNTLFSIFLEKKLHARAILVMAAFRIVGRIMGPYVIFWIGFSFSQIGLYYDYDDAAYDLLRQNGIDAALFVADKHCNPLIPDVLRLGRRQIIVLKGMDMIGRDDIPALALEAALSLNNHSIYAHYASIILQDIVFAIILLVFQKRVLKKIHKNGLDSAVAFLLAEEVLTLSTKRYLQAIFRPLERHALDKGLNIAQEYSKDGRISAIFAHAFASGQNIFPSKLCKFLNGERNVCEYASKILKST